MNAAEYTCEIKHFMANHKEHSIDFKILVMRLLTLYSDNIKLVAAITCVPETIILEWKSDWNRVIINPQNSHADFVFVEQKDPWW